MRRLLVLRPEPGASATVDRARGCGMDAVAVPLFEIEPIAWEAPSAAPFDALLVTSANALRYGGEELLKLRGLEVYAVGEPTADAAREAGFSIASVGDSGVDRLLGSIDPGLKLLHLCGEDRREPEAARQEIAPVAVYRARKIHDPDLGGIGDAVALVHSPRAGRRFAALVSDRSSVSIAAISDTAADAVGSGWAAVEVASAPTDEALLALAARLCNNPAPNCPALAREWAGARDCSSGSSSSSSERRRRSGPLAIIAQRRACSVSCPRRSR
jgi:uroporphyrinogen-III synthase